MTDPDSDNPLQTATGSNWDRLIEAIGPASILLVIERRMSRRLLREWSPVDDDDRFGVSVAALGDLDGDGVTDLTVGAHRDGDGGTNRGAAWILFMNTDGTVKAEQKISSTQGGFGGQLDNEDRFGRSVGGLGDLDGDTVIDLAVGAYFDDDGGTNRGAVWVLFLNTDGTVKAEQDLVHPGRLQRTGVTWRTRPSRALATRH